MTTELVSSVDFDQSVTDATGQLGIRSRRIYEGDARALAEWMQEHGLRVKDLTRSHMIAYRQYLADKYAKATAQRMFVVARRILNEQVISEHILANPAATIKGFTLANESPHIALTRQQATDLLASIDRSTLNGKRDFALVSLLLRTGIRRSECAALNVGDLVREQGHTIALVQHGKGDKRRKVKLPPDVFRAIEEYIHAARASTSPDAPLFVGFMRWIGLRITDKLIARTVQRYGPAIGVANLTPHDLRATFITLALEGGASLQQTQYAAGHSDPRLTERYQSRKLNLDDNAVDYIKL